MYPGNHTKRETIWARQLFTESRADLIPLAPVRRIQSMSIMMWKLMQAGWTKCWSTVGANGRFRWLLLMVRRP